MAMNFKVFGNKELTTAYVADIMRKQFNNNPTSIVGVHIQEEDMHILDELKKDVDRHPVDFSQIEILDYDNNGSFYKALGVPNKQIHSLQYNENVENYIKDKVKTKDNKGKLIFQVVSVDAKGSLNLKVDSNLMNAREVMVVATGANKADFIKKLYEENGSSFEPAGLNNHRMVNVILDEEAARGLPEDVKTYFTQHFA
ncbi:6-phosphogluconolactonase [Staphylococcus massiliensis]|uniref:Glucosamine-6-phosphate isomerase n=1 Tax=Staphylococcus massiliensis S46 TaxID=1229783 RepID=K9AGZ5_9STAP|nr:hypothetical protein [Staphylococcus massiliensis]EKU46593.1 hypothetical protein C273_09091 [Staphylococcus massiliensis S46]MCG3399641.1 glucosamine-6-phosphate isomerase [Staphylococcus massiliensis]MCG3400746.1 glucosamine-6-phosphate isomerase [Staphylococcus massiliensis]MCG3412090.1 glucosamine-6-phosphate isomerase [Staphylococcus massiliensis]PNZ98669.1 glucosamine-6-phosphate isomerase [Staphylococcus massiliensis CCUG 55927]